MGQFSDFVIDNGIIGFFDTPMTLKSGRQSHFYVNWRKATNDAFLLDKLTDALVAFIHENKVVCDSLYGVPEGASKTAVIAAMKLAKQDPRFGPGSHGIAMGRAKPKPHGDPSDRFFIGEPRGRVYVLEDTITTGLSLFNCLDQLREAGIKVAGVIGLTDRCETRDDGSTVAQHLARAYGEGISYHVMSRAPELLKSAIRRQNPDPQLIKALAAELGMSTVELTHEEVAR